MAKKILSIGVNIPNYSDSYISFSSKISLMDADVVIISPNIGYFQRDNDYLGKTCYSSESSFLIKEHIRHWKNELIEFLKSGKTVFFILNEKKEFHLHTGQKTYSGTGRNRITTNIVNLHDNYEILPIDIGEITSAKGNLVNFTGNQIFSTFYNNFKDYLSYQVYIKNADISSPIFVGKNKSNILGALYKVGGGNFITLPELAFDEDEFTEFVEIESGEEEEFWTKEGVDFGKRLINCISEIDNNLKNISNKTPNPDWISNNEYSSNKEIEIYEKMNKNSDKIKSIEIINEKLVLELQEELQLKDLLFENGKPLENAVIKALKLLGFEAKTFDDGEHEFDQIITCPEGHRYIGECEGKDSKDINISKFRQLVDSLNADFSRDEVEERANGILFGNPQRLIEPSKRKLDFTKKCKAGALREKIVLVKTSDLFTISLYLKNNKDVTFSKKCRDSIYKNLGNIVEFPNIPVKKE